jgi:uncharacterized protein with von Willebrand factor type A (vWA) domain
MPYKRRLSKANATKITPEVLALFKEGQRLHHRQDRSDEDRRAYSRASYALDAALGLRPWMEPVLDTVGLTEPPEWMDTELEQTDWHRSAELRRQLEAALVVQRARRPERSSA